MSTIQLFPNINSLSLNMDNEGGGNIPHYELSQIAERLQWTKMDEESANKWSIKVSHGIYFPCDSWFNMLKV